MSKIKKYNVQKKQDSGTVRVSAGTSIIVGSTKADGINEGYVQAELAKYLRKDILDYAYKLITFVDGLSLGDGSHGIDAQGIATLRTLILGDGSVSGVASADTSSTDANSIATPAYVNDRFLSKLSPDTAQGLITFLQGLTSQELVTLMKGIAIGTGYGIDAESVARLKALILDNASIDAEGNAVVGSVKSADYRSGLLDGSGFAMYKEDDSGNTVVEVDKLNVRKKAVFAKLDVREFAFTSGDVGYTSAGCRIERVTQLANGDYRCYWLAEQDGVKIENAWHVGDQAMCRTSNIINRETSMAANRYYWRLVVGKGDDIIDGKLYHFIDLSDSRETVKLTTDGEEHTCVGYDTSVVNDAPQAEDSIVQLGSQTDENRRYAYVVYVSEGKRVDYDGINGYDLDSHIVEIHSREVNYMRSERFELVTGGNIHVPLVTERGAWTAGTTAYHYDHFSYNNATWLCIVGKGQTTTEEPTDGSSVWIKETYGMKGDEPAGLRLTSTSLSVSIDKNGKVVMPGDIIVTAAVSNLTGTPSWDIVGNGGTSIDSDVIANSVSADGLKLTIVQGMMATAFETNQWTYARVTCSLGGYTDYVTILPVNDGEPGAPGKDAVTVRLVPDKIVVDTDDNGTVTSAALANAMATIDVRKGDNAYDAFIGSYSASDGIGVSTTDKTVKIDRIDIDPSTKTEENPAGYAYASGWVDVTVIVDGKWHIVRLTVETNIHKVVAKFMVKADSIEASVTSLTQQVGDNWRVTDSRLTMDERKINENVTAVTDLGTRVSDVEQTAEEIVSTVSSMGSSFGQQISKISQKADSISLKVSETLLSGNLLTGTMFRRESEVTWNNPSYKGVISTAVQLGGVNSVYLESTYTSTTNKGIKWLKIPVTGSKTYSLSFWYRTPDTSANDNFTVMVNAYKADGTSAADSNPINVTALPIPANDTWKLYSADMTLGSDVAAVDVLIYLATKGKMYIARPMLIEGDYVGWQRSEQDYDYIGGNLLDETKTLTKRGNLTHKDGTVTGNAFGWCSAIYAQGASPYTEMLQWMIPYDLNADYTLSFMAKGTGKIQAHIYSSAGTADVALFTERECEDYDVGEWGSALYTLTPDWKRRTVRWRTKGTRTQTHALVAIRVDQGNEAYISQPKLEKGCTATEWTDGDGDMVSTKALLATGIDIENRTVVVTADHVYFQNNAGDMTAMVNDDGKIQARLIEADRMKAWQVAQPFEEYSDLGAFLSGDSYSWVLKDVSALNGSALVLSSLTNGTVLNAYNATRSNISVTVPLVASMSSIAAAGDHNENATVVIPPGGMLRALTLVRTIGGSEVKGLYLLVPFTRSGNTITIKSFDG